MLHSSPPTGTEELVPPGVPIDLTNCDREPIHIPGAIQPHGALLVLREPELTIVQVSANVDERLGRPVDALLGTRLADVFGAAQAEAVLAALAVGLARTFRSLSLVLPATATVAGETRHFDAVVHRNDSVVILELEPAVGGREVTARDVQALVQRTMENIEGAETLVDLAQAIAEQMRSVTGLDRVWVYRFHEDWHGEIIGESKRADIETWLGMHYPASDIPVQARALFLRHWLRMIVDIDYTPVPLLPRDNPVTNAPLDMSGTVLRATSPIHVEYLQNMGVSASLVISLIRRGQLWGLISGHHYSGPKFVPYATRALCELLAQAFSMQLDMAERVEDRERALAVRADQARLILALGTDRSLAAALTADAPTLLDLVCATGAAVCVDGDVTSVGATPPREWIQALVPWLAERRTPVYATRALPAEYGPAAEVQRLASGLLAVHVSATRPDYLIWFREESRQTVRWAGDPRKAVTMTEGSAPRLSPRGSFELWEETVRGTSAAWLPEELEAAGELRGTIIDLLLGRSDEVAALNVELQSANDQLQENAAELEVQAEELAMQTEELRSQADELLAEREAREEALRLERAARAEAESANRSKAEFLAMMSHELRTPLNAIGGYAQLMELGVRGPTTDEQRADLGRIQSSQQHLLGLINSILNFARLESGQVAFSIAAVPLARVLSATHALIAPQLRDRGLADDWSGCSTMDGDGVRVQADEEKFRQILLNLLSNAVKFTEPGGAVAVGCDVDDGTVTVHVRDTGRGIPRDRLEQIFEPFVQVHREAQGAAQGVGLGLAISRDLARRMGGDLTLESEVDVGSTFTLTLPRAT